MHLSCSCQLSIDLISLQVDPHSWYEMTQMIQPKILNLSDVPQIIEFEMRRLESSIPDAADRELYSWSASWRKESLEHYLPLGWSFGIWGEGSGQLEGYFIAQPQIFTRGMTQTLWVERLVSSSPKLSADLVELVYGLCREKHFQKAVFFVHADTSFANSVFQLNQVSDSLMELKTAKF